MASTTFVDGETLIEAAWLNDVNAAVYTPGTIDAANVSNTPAGTIAAITVQAAINELDGDIQTKQPLDNELTALATATAAANKIPYFTSTTTASTLTRSIDGTLAGNSDTNIPTEKAVKTAIGTLSTVVQRAYAEYTAITGITTVIPLDDTTPTATEGDQILSVSITPKSATNRLRVKFCGFVSNSINGSSTIVSLFDGTTCKNASLAFQNSLQLASSLSCEAEWVPGDTSAHTISVRVGPSANTAYVNANYSGTRYFGGTAKSTLIVEELFA